MSDISELIHSIHSQIEFYTKEKQEPQPDYYRGVCTGALLAYRNILDILGDKDD